MLMVESGGGAWPLQLVAELGVWCASGRGWENLLCGAELRGGTVPFPCIDLSLLAACGPAELLLQLERRHGLLCLGPLLLP